MPELTNEELRQTAAALNAFADGRTIECKFLDGGDWRECLSVNAENLWHCVLTQGAILRPKPEPPVRLWNCPADVPPYCWLRSNRNPEEIQALVVSVSPRGVEWFTNSERFIPWGDERWQYLEYSTDRKTWHPCTVTEEA